MYFRNLIFFAYEAALIFSKVLIQLLFILIPTPIVPRDFVREEEVRGAPLKLKHYRDFVNGYVAVLKQIIELSIFCLTIKQARNSLSHNEMWCMFQINHFKQLIEIKEILC